MTVEVKEVAENTFLLDCGPVPVYSMPQVAYLLVDDTTALIEPGCTTAASRLLRDSKRLGLDLEQVSYIIPTHIHVDHGGGAGYLAERLPGAKVLLHPKGARHMIDPSRLVQGTKVVFGEHFDEAFGPIVPVPEDRIHVAKDGETLRLGKRELTILFSPGHASHHISIMDSLTGGLFCGEALGFPLDNAPDMILPAGIPPFDPELYLESMDRLERLAPRLLFYSHIGLARNDGNDLIRRVKESSIAFGRIVGKAVNDGEDDQSIRARLSNYIGEKSPGAGLPTSFLFDPSGYIDYFRNKK